ncbi:hypothetical protein ALC62_11478 [Cyphomyrmex costatus]|uniref:SAP domain-containing protein n=1 Tax=Cyphomyrmex costatus TaxID=456900 RepID=A0A151ICK7_9HYME|nr:hypothetical protein ALC62_11478 [Cyphomyrmex costatus]
MNQFPVNYTTIQLKEKLRELNLATTGNKAELLKRLHEADPNGGWMEENSEAQGPSEVITQDDQNEIEANEMLTMYEREIEIFRREEEVDILHRFQAMGLRGG